MSLGSLSARLLPAERGVPPFVTFGDLRGGKAGGAGYLGTGYNPFVIEGNGGDAKANRAASFKVRGITLDGKFTLEELEKRDLPGEARVQLG